ncbi:MAG: lipid-A-disaccharide synthase N-terminal domain-containing protein, partial [Phycisphaerales bacterium]|nr:lipid-A-disaccharide synthase N-terminal domain-containing protein [Phycisphaerales bacterium]
MQKISNPLVIFGLVGQCVFMMRFVVQWFASERRGR